jgi:hypothetical protein
MYSHINPQRVFQETFFLKDNNDWDSDNDDAGTNNSIYDWNNHLASCEWGQFTRDPFNKLFRDNWVEYISLEGSTNGDKKKLSHPIQYVGNL